MWLSAYLSQPPPEIPITCGHDVAPVLLHTLAYAVICIGPAVQAGQPLHSRILQRRTFVQPCLTRLGNLLAMTQAGCQAILAGGLI